MEGMPNAAKSLGLAACTAVVVGNMVGSGFYLSPGAVAPYGGLAILSWVVIPYAFCALAVSLVAARTADSAGVDAKIPRIGAVEIIAFVFSVFTVYGCGADAVLYGLLLLLGIPVYVWQGQRNGTLSLTAG